MSRFLQSLIIASSLSRQICTQAHMQIAYPYPLRSPLDPSVPVALKDYSMTSPLLADGSNFPCKQYQYNDTNPQAYDIKATYQTGGSYNLTLAGTATHMGGSCQISLSYDNGASFKVIQSLIGGCPLDPTLNFTIPSFAPPSDTALLSWSWFNLIGNREVSLVPDPYLDRPDRWCWSFEVVSRMRSSDICFQYRFLSTNGVSDVPKLRSSPDSKHADATIQAKYSQIILEATSFYR